MTTLRELGQHELQRRLHHEGLRLTIGPYSYVIRTDVPVICEGIQTLYADYALADPDGFADFHVALKPPNLLQRLRGRLQFYFDYASPFNRVEASQAYAAFEWSMNWCISSFANDFLKLHAAVLARNGVAVILPGLPGAGKSTLCAALALRGWQVLSDEHALVPFHGNSVVPICRPVSLKNNSIDIIRNRDPEAVFGPESDETHKGLVAHLKADRNPDSHSTEPVPARLMLFPQYVAGADVQLERRTRAESFLFAANHSFNYSELSSLGFETMSTLMDAVECYEFTFGDLDAAIEALEDLHRGFTS